MSATEQPGPDPRPTLILVTGDLFLGSRLRGMAESAGYQVVTTPGVARLAELSATAGSLRVLIDLTSLGADPRAILDQLGAEDAIGRIAAYAPHVRVDLLRAARAAGLRSVFTRGQLETQLPCWLSS